MRQGDRQRAQRELPGGAQPAAIVRLPPRHMGPCAPPGPIRRAAPNQAGCAQSGGLRPIRRAAPNQAACAQAGLRAIGQRARNQAGCAQSGGLRAIRRPARNQAACTQSGGLHAIRRPAPNQAVCALSHARPRSGARPCEPSPWAAAPAGVPDKAQGGQTGSLLRTSRVSSAPAVFAPAWGRRTRRRKDGAETAHTVRRRRHALPPSRRTRCVAGPWFKPAALSK
jgi:hypothetical protein